MNTSGRPKRLVSEATFVIFIVFKKNQNVVTLPSQQKAPGHRQMMEIQRPPEVASNKNYPVRKEARWTILPNKLTANDSDDR